MLAITGSHLTGATNYHEISRGITPISRCETFHHNNQIHNVLTRILAAKNNLEWHTCGLCTIHTDHESQLASSPSAMFKPETTTAFPLVRVARTCSVRLHNCIVPNDEIAATESKKNALARIFHQFCREAAQLNMWQGMRSSQPNACF